jgi:uncharacterized protein (TIGR02569 family)
VSPPVGVLRAFGVDGPVHPLPGGQGTSWAAGDLVLKRDAGACHDWLGEVLTEVEPTDVRIAKPVRSRRSSWRHEGWSATRRLEGAPPDASTTAWLDVIGAGRAFHRAVSHLPRPDCLDRRSDPWAEADRAAWVELPLHLHPAFTAVAARLGEALEPLGPSQLVHGDLAGNVLFARGRPPAVIDLSPYWRPPAYAEGIVLADALCWHDAPPSLVPDAGVPVAAVARGLLFRMLTTSGRVAGGEVPEDAVGDEARRYDDAASAIEL